MFMTAAEHMSIYRTMAASVIEDEVTIDPPGLDPRVLKGCDLLDREHPGWADKIDLDNFRLTSSTNCVIGQVFGEYSDHVGYVLPESDGGEEVTPQEEAHGFCLNKSPDDEWDRLNSDWVTAISERQTR